jgi:hypothetical protein
LGDRTLSVWNAPQNSNTITYHSSTYDTNPANGNIWRNVVLEDGSNMDSRWNFIYFGFSRASAKAFFYAWHSKS